MPGHKSFNADPHPGDLREQIDIVREANEINENGYPETTFVTIADKVWATVDDAGNQGFRAGDSEISRNMVNFVIRHRSDLEVGMYVVFEGERRMIVDIGHYGFKRRYLRLKTALNRAVAK